MKKAIKDYSSDAIAMIVLALIAVFVGGYILSNQRFYLPAWVPFVGTDFYTLNAEMQTAQAITPGQGQTVAMSGVPVGEISAVTLKNGRAVVKMSIQAKYADDIHKNATILTRPKTGLNDMLLQLNPGTKAGGSAPDGYTIPVSQTLPNVNPDEILASLDTGTRNYLKLLIGGAGEGLRGNSKELAATLKRFDPTARDVDKITKLLAVRRGNIARNIHNLKLISGALAEKDQDLTAFVDSSNAVFRDFADQDQSLTAALSELPTALTATNSAVISANTLAQTLQSTTGALLPFARNLAPASITSQDFFKQTTDVLKDQLRPFSVAAQPTVANLKPASSDLATATPNLATSVDVLNYAFNILAYNPKGSSNEGYLFWLAWLNHLGPLLFTNQDALGPVRRGIFMVNCPNATTVYTLAAGNKPLNTLSALINAPTPEEVYPPGSTRVCRNPGSTAAATRTATKDTTATSGTAQDATATTTTPAAAPTGLTETPATTPTPAPATADATPTLTQTPDTGGTR